MTADSDEWDNGDRSGSRPEFGEFTLFNLTTGTQVASSFR